MKFHMLRTGHYLKILLTIVELIAVDMMHYFVFRKRSSNHGFRDRIVLSLASAVDIENAVSIMKCAAPRRSLAHFRITEFLQALIMVAAKPLGIMRTRAFFIGTKTAIARIIPQGSGSWITVLYESLVMPSAVSKIDRRTVTFGKFASAHNVLIVA